MEMVTIIKSRFKDNESGGEVIPISHYKYFIQYKDVSWMDIDTELANGNKHIEIEFPLSLLEQFIDTVRKKQQTNKEVI